MAFYGDRSGIFVRHDDDWTRKEELAGKQERTRFGRALEHLGISNGERPAIRFLPIWQQLVYGWSPRTLYL